MAQTFEFSAAAALAARRLRRSKRDLTDKINEIRLRSPQDTVAFDVLADLVLARLDAEEQPTAH